MSRFIESTKPVIKTIVDKDSKAIKAVHMVEITRKDTDDPNFIEVETVEKDSIFDPTSKNYNKELDRE